jgi:hypothetical protein
VSISRLFLRALAVTAIQRNDGEVIPPTMADQRVFDSRLDPLSFTYEDNEIPVVVVYTDDDHSELLNRGDNSGPRVRVVDLRVEISVGAFDSVIVDNEEQTSFALPVTDAQMEAKLDLFEQQVMWALLRLPNRPYTNAFVRYVVRVESIASHASRSEDGNNRFAQRVLHFKCAIPDDCPPSSEIVPPNQQPSALTVLTFEDVPGSPWLGTMLDAMTNSPSMRAVLDVLTGSGNPYAHVPLLKRIGMYVDAIEPEADQNILSAEGRTHGPDGRIEVENLWTAP